MPSRTIHRVPRRVPHETIHKHIGHNYIDRNYIGRNHIGHNYVGHNYLGRNYTGRNCIGRNCIIVDRIFPYGPTEFKFDYIVGPGVSLGPTNCFLECCFPSNVLRETMLSDHVGMPRWVSPCAFLGRRSQARRVRGAVAVGLRRDGPSLGQLQRRHSGSLTLLGVLPADG